MRTRRPRALEESAKASHPGTNTAVGWKDSSGNSEKGIHPKTGAALLPAMELDPVIPPARGNVVEDEHKPLDGFYEYVFFSLPKVVPLNSGEGPSTSDRQMALLERIRAKERTMRTDSVTREPRATSCLFGK